MGSLSRGYCSTPASCESLYTTASDIADLNCGYKFNND